MSLVHRLIDTHASVPENTTILPSVLAPLNQEALANALTSVLAAFVSPEGIVIVGYALAIVIKLYGPEGQLLDQDIQALGSEIDVNIDTDLEIPIVSDFTPTEFLVVALSVFYQYAVVTPQTGLQALLTNVTYLVLFGIFMDYVVSRYLVNQGD